MGILEILRLTIEKMQGKWLFAIVVVAMVSIITMSVPRLITPALGPLEFWVDMIWMIMVSAPVAMGAMWLFLDMHDGREGEIRHVFDVFKDYGRVVGAVFWKYLLIFLWMLLLFIPGIFAMLRYSQMEFLMKDDPTLTGQAAVSKSKEMMRGNKARYFGLYLMIFWPAFLGMAIGSIMIMNSIYTVGNMVYTDPDQASTGQLIITISAIGMNLLSALAYPAFATFYRDLKPSREVINDEWDLDSL